MLLVACDCCTSDGGVTDWFCSELDDGGGSGCGEDGEDGTGGDAATGEQASVRVFGSISSYSSSLLQ